MERIDTRISNCCEQISAVAGTIEPGGEGLNNISSLHARRRHSGTPTKVAPR